MTFKNNNNSETKNHCKHCVVCAWPFSWRYSSLEEMLKKFFETMLHFYCANELNLAMVK